MNAFVATLGILLILLTFGPILYHPSLPTFSRFGSMVRTLQQKIAKNIPNRERLLD